MFAFIYPKKPRSVNARRKDAYQKELQAAYQRTGSAPAPNGVPLYGTVYYFFKRPLGTDADNLSKPVWDALKGMHYADDSQIHLRHAGVVDLRRSTFEEFELSGLPDAVADDFMDAFNCEQHFMYIEIGQLQPHMYQFGPFK